MNPILLRKQLQENSSDLQDFCKDLKNWGEEMKRKEEFLINGDKKTSSDKSEKSRKISSFDKESKKKISPKMPASKMGATDYAAWDKFDADAECEKLEDDLNEDSDLTDECTETMQDLAILEKEEGNRFVRKQKWDEAIKSYSKAIKYYSYDPIFYANRALCYLKKSNFEEAEKDCTLSLKLDNKYVKAYQRRSAAREGLNKLESAEYDLLEVLELEPKNKESQQSLERLRVKLKTTDRIEDQRPVSKFTASRNKSNINKTSTVHPTNYLKLDTQNIESEKVFDTSTPVPLWPEEENIILVKPIKKPPHMRSKVPLKRIKIIEKDGTRRENKVHVASEPEAIKKHVFEKQEKLEPVKDASVFKKARSECETIEQLGQNVSAFKRSQMKDISDNLEHSTAWPKPNDESLSIKSNDFKIIEKEPPDDKLLTTSITKELKNTSNINISNGHDKLEKNEINTEFVKPKTSVQFSLTWKNLETSEQKYRYLKVINPEDVPKIFLNSLESHVFSDILEVLVKHFVENKDPVFNILDCFTQVKRFSTVTMFMSSSDKRNLWILFDYIKEAENKNKEDVDKLVEKYEL